MASQNYSPSLHHQSSTKITFIKIEGNNLAVYFPQSNHKIPKTRFWKDAKEIPSNIKLFAQYNLCGATIELAPTGLSKKRTWRRKYPISITFELPYLYQMVGNMGVKNRAIIQKDTCGGRRLYLFARTHREKYDWYFRLKHASYSGHERMSQSQAFATFVASMKAAYPNLRYVPATPTTRSYEWKPIVKGLFSPTPPFVSLIIARYCFGFLNSSNWRNEIRRKIEKQLRAARKPAFVESVTIKELNLGTTLAKFPAAANPFLDSGGIWFDIGMEYEGKIQITLEFIFNFFNTREMKMLKDKPGRSQTAYKQAIFDSNAEDSGDASETDLAKFTDKIANSAVMRNGIVHDIVEKIAALPVLLTVEVTKVSGILAVNIPMVSSDRVWIGFRDNPVIEMEVIPKVTAWQWAVNLLKGWIKKRMLLAFQHCMVCPNMLDIRVNLEPTSSTNNS
ncbi:unnamed protein product [Orchesella dallaii]|uniref:SMP-LTD domain-containing protein n=1 Tax=Orchesella dallaii TaxID=48710 RepID=A0ABP1PLS7_9HEXA